MKVKPSAEALVDMDERNVLGMIWNVILKSIKITDEETTAMNAKDALLLWCKNRIADYPDVTLDNWKGFNDGTVLCALLHKQKPHEIAWETIKKENGPQNLQLAMKLAHKYWELEPFLSPEDFVKLEENSMMVFVSDFVVLDRLIYFESRCQIFIMESLIFASVISLPAG